MKQFWSDLGGKLGVGLCAAGFLLVFMGWNGAASSDRVPSQFPYLISGGVAGLCLVIVGVGMIVVQNQRADRAELQATLREIRAVLAGEDASASADFEMPPLRPTPDHYAAALRPVDIETSGDASAADTATATPAKRTSRSRRQLRAD